MDDEEPPGGGVTEEGLNDPVTCVGMLFTLMTTGELKLPIEFTKTLTLPHAPGLTLTRFGLTDMLKSEVIGAVPVTVRVTVTLCVITGRDDVPVTVSV